MLLPSFVLFSLLKTCFGSQSVRCQCYIPIAGANTTDWTKQVNNLRTNDKNTWQRILHCYRHRLYKAEPAEHEQGIKKTGVQTEAVPDSRSWVHPLLTVSMSYTAVMQDIKQKARRKPSVLSRHFSLFCTLSAIHCPYIWLTSGLGYQCPNCPEQREKDCVGCSEGA